MTRTARYLRTFALVSSLLLTWGCATNPNNTSAQNASVASDPFLTATNGTTSSDPTGGLTSGINSATNALSQTPTDTAQQQQAVSDSTTALQGLGSAVQSLLTQQQQTQAQAAAEAEAYQQALQQIQAAQQEAAAAQQQALAAALQALLQKQIMWRWVNAGISRHVMSTNLAANGALAAQGWVLEGGAFWVYQAPQGSCTYSLESCVASTSGYTPWWFLNDVNCGGYSDQGPQGYVCPAALDATSPPIYRLMYNVTGSPWYGDRISTVNVQEMQALVSSGWIIEGGQGYAPQ